MPTIHWAKHTSSLQVRSSLPKHSSLKNKLHSKHDGLCTINIHGPKSTAPNVLFPRTVPPSDGFRLRMLTCETVELAESVEVVDGAARRPSKTLSGPKVDWNIINIYIYITWCKDWRKMSGKQICCSAHWDSSCQHSELVDHHLRTTRTLWHYSGPYNKQTCYSCYSASEPHIQTWGWKQCWQEEEVLPVASDNSHSHSFKSTVIMGHESTCSNLRCSYNWLLQYHQSAVSL